MNYVCIVMCMASMICSIFAVLIIGEILPPIDPADLSVGLLFVMALMCVHLAVEASGADDDGDQSES